MAVSTQNLNSEALKAAIQAVEENNSMNDGAWADWDDADHVAATYEIDLCDEGMAIINRAIASNGASLAGDMQAAELAVMGQNFAGSFWDRA